MQMTLISLDEVVKRTDLSKATIWRLIKASQFPAPLKLSTQRRAWIEAEIDEKMAALPIQRPSR